MSDLRNCTFKPSYDSKDFSDIVEEFYCPALSNCSRYDRQTGFFTSASMSIAARGMVNFIKNNGKMRLVTSPVLSEDDVQILNECYSNPDNLKERLSEIIDLQLDEQFLKDDSNEALGWMLLNNLLEIRLVLIKNENAFATAEEINQRGIFHNKIGIFRDDQDNTVTFSGSINETFSGWGINIESFEVFTSWEDGPKHISSHLERFEKYWNKGETEFSITVDFPEAVKKKWIESVPKERTDLRIFRSTAPGLHLRPYQISAIDSWLANNRRGIFDMATGTGKTLTAIFAIKKAISIDSKQYLLVVSVPNQHLIEDPWIKNIEKYLLTEQTNYSIIQAFAGNKNWRSDLDKAKMSYRLKMLDAVIVVTTYATFCTEDFIKKIRSFGANRYLLADEVHNVGAEEYRTGLLEEYTFRLGLSATPARYLDDDGTQFIENYFEGEIFTFSIKDAIKTINPDTGKTYLSPYYYHPIFVSLSEEELSKYSELSKKIAKAFSNDDPTPQERHYRNMLLIKRAKIGKNAYSKISKLESIIPELKKNGIFNHCLVYCSDGKDPTVDEKTLTTVIDLLNQNGIIARRFTSEDSFDIRPQILTDFSKGDISTLVAIKCLDEGVDVPSTKNAIIMASTGNPREYIQRRGRILRQSEGKEYSILYDFVIIPTGNPRYRDAESHLFSVEYKRFKEFSDLSLNKNENEKIIQEIIDEYGLAVIDDDNIS